MGWGRDVSLAWAGSTEVILLPGRKWNCSCCSEWQWQVMHSSAGKEGKQRLGSEFATKREYMATVEGWDSYSSCFSLLEHLCFMSKCKPRDRLAELTINFQDADNQGTLDRSGTLIHDCAWFIIKEVCADFTDRITACKAPISSANVWTITALRVGLQLFFFFHVFKMWSASTPIFNSPNWNEIKHEAAVHNSK